MTPVVTVHGAGVVDPFSKPGLPSSCVVVPPPPDAVTVKAIGALRLMPPPVALTFTFNVPVVAVPLAENVSVELPLPGAAIEAGLKLAVTPLGKPVAVSVTAELNPPLTVVETVVLAALPWATDTLAGEALRARFGVWPEVTVKETVEVWVIPPPVACIVTVAVPVVAVLLAVNLRVELPVPGAAMEVGVKLAVTPVGMPVADNDTAELKPPVPAVETVVVTELPWAVDTLVGEELRENPAVPGLKIMSSTGWISIPFGATPVCPCRKSNIPTPTICTGMFAVWKLVVAVNLASNLEREFCIPAKNGL